MFNERFLKRCFSLMTLATAIFQYMAILHHGWLKPSTPWATPSVTHFPINYNQKHRYCPKKQSCVKALSIQLDKLTFNLGFPKSPYSHSTFHDFHISSIQDSPHRFSVRLFSYSSVFLHIFTSLYLNCSFLRLKNKEVKTKGVLALSCLPPYWITCCHQVERYIFVTQASPIQVVLDPRC